MEDKETERNLNEKSDSKKGETLKATTRVKKLSGSDGSDGSKSGKSAGAKSGRGDLSSDKKKESNNKIKDNKGQGKFYTPNTQATAHKGKIASPDLGGGEKRSMTDSVK